MFQFGRNIVDLNLVGSVVNDGYGSYSFYAKDDGRYLYAMPLSDAAFDVVATELGVAEDDKIPSGIWPKEEPTPSGVFSYKAAG